MRRKRSLPLIIVFIMILLSLPVAVTGRLRSQVVSFLSSFFKESEKKLTPDEVLKRQIDRLKQQNSQLKEKLIYLTSQLKQSTLYNQTSEKIGALKLERRREELRRFLTLSHDGVHAKIIYRPITSWNRGFWVDAGEEVNKRFGITAIAKNSPVLVNGHLIGVVSEITAEGARIALITDAEISVAVRVQREEARLAKGELHGSEVPYFAKGTTLLKGEGFNYDFSDEEGPSLDLRSWEPYILKVGDTLVTSGLDGVFPSGIPVATVKEISSLKEGDYTYSLTAEPLEALDNLSTVFILPPLSS